MSNQSFQGSPSSRETIGAASKEVPLPSNIYIKSLLWGGGNQSNTITIDSSPITYSFWSDSSLDDGSTGGDIDQTDTPWQDFEIQAMQAALQTWANVANITFAQASDNDPNADLKVVLVDESELPGDLGRFGPPGDQGAGIGYFNYEVDNWNASGLKQGGYNFITLIHELGHGLGLKHPHDVTDGGNSNLFPGVTDGNSGALGDNKLNQGIWTTMSYNDGLDTNEYLDAIGNRVITGYGYQGTPMAFDIAAIQYLYGANLSYNLGNQTYNLPTTDGDGTFYSCIWDAGGNDTISAASAKEKATINLNAAPLAGANAGGYISSVGNIYGGYTIANQVVIENAIGGDAGDAITGNASSNSLQGGAGNDQIDGAAGDDTLDGGLGNDSIQGGLGNDSMLGGLNNDTLEGGAGSDTLDGGLGSDSLVGGLDSDSYLIDGNTDIIVESANAGLDTVFSSVNYSLSDNLESLTLTGDGALNGTGNGLDNTLVGNAANNYLYASDGADRSNGAAGDDYLYGQAGNDSLDGGLGKDWLVGDMGDDLLTGGDGKDRVLGGLGDDSLSGGRGKDQLRGGGDADRFVFNSFREGFDTIADFRRAEGDRIVVSKSGFGGGLKLGKLRSSRFTLGSSSTDDRAGFVFDDDSGRLFFDRDGQGGDKQVLIAKFSGGASLNRSSILVVT